MYILNSPILGKILNKYALVLNQQGLYRKIRVNNQRDFKIFITDDVRKIAEIFALDFDTLSNKRDEEGCEFIKTSPYFTPHVFTYPTSKKDDEKIIMMKSLITEDDLNKEVLPIDTTRVMEVVGDDSLLDTINYYKETLEKAYKAYRGGFAAMKKEIIDSGYDVRNFSRDLPLFMKSFSHQEDRMISFHEESTETMTKRFFDNAG